jgi:spore maturation protein CgeB
VRIVVFGLSVSSSWGNGHATLWRGLLGALARRRHEVVFFEKDVPYYAAHRDLTDLGWLRLVLYGDWRSVERRARVEVTGADVAIVTSFCPDAVEATELVISSRALRVFYDLDTPVTLAKSKAGERVFYLGPRALQDFDLVLSFTGGRALLEMRELLGARHVEPLYGSVDPQAHHPAPSRDHYRSLLSYLGTYSSDRQKALDAFFFEPARRLSAHRFVLGGALYPAEHSVPSNVHRFEHVAPPEHAVFFGSSSVTLNLTRGVMAQYGHCPSGRLFEASACGTPILTDYFEGLETFFEPGRELLVAETTEQVLDALSRSPRDLRLIGERARTRVLQDHTADARAQDFERIVDFARTRKSMTS